MLHLHVVQNLVAVAIIASAGGNAIDKTSVMGVFVLPAGLGTISTLNFAGARMLHLVQNLVAVALIAFSGGYNSVCRGERNR